jgi:taurine transport system permease protein
MNSTAHKAKRQYVALAILSPLVIFLLWTFVTMRGAVPPTILPSPGAVAASFLDMIQQASWT